MMSVGRNQGSLLTRKSGISLATGVLPLCFVDGQDADTLGLSGEEVFEIHGVAAGLTPKKTLKVTAKGADGSVKSFDVVCRVDTPNEVEYVKHGGILQYVLRGMAQG